MSKNLFLWALILVLLNGISLGQEKVTYSLEEAIRLALVNNPQIKIAEKEIDSAKGKRLQAFSLAPPELAFSWEGIPSGKSFSQANERTVSLEQNLEFPVKLFLRKDAATKELEISYERLNRAKALVAAEVKKAYYQVNYQQGLVETLEFTLDLLKQFQEATRIKYQSGELPYFEVIRANVEVAKTQNEIIEAKQELISVKNNFNLILGKRGSEDFELKDELRFTPYLKNEEETLNEYRAENRTLRIAQIFREKENVNLKLANLTFIPDLKLSGGFFSESGEKFILSFQIGLSLPLWWWNAKGQIQENRADFQTAQIKQETALRVVQSEIEKAYKLVRTSEEQVLLFEKTLLKEIDEELKAGINSYQYNQIDALGLLDIYRTNKMAKIEYYKALLNYLSGLADLEVAGEETD
ncbi:MAG: TolC family protein [candidate division Zixibacteria bacterium]|nr:TolC family protein [candidate division Zixibacteria bacterium]